MFLLIFAAWVAAMPAQAANLSLNGPFHAVKVPMDFPGTLFVPDDSQPHPGVVVLHGSEGGSAPYSGYEAEFLATHGFAAMALCYFGCNDARVPDQLFDVDLSLTYEAFRWLRASTFVQKRPTALFGASRGAEQALVLSVYLAKYSHFKLPNAVAAHAPFAQVVPGYSSRFNDPACWTGHAYEKGDWIPSCGIGPGENHPAWNWYGSVAGLRPGSPIEITHYSGNLFVTHGMKDEVWEVAASQALENELREAGAAVSARTLPLEIDLDHFHVVPNPKPVRAEFNYFEGQGHVFKGPAFQVQMILLVDFLKRSLAGSLTDPYVQ